MIRTLSLQNFKCFRQLELTLAPLTLLAGMNGMGKSTIMQSMLLLRQSFRSGDLDEGRLLLGGDLTDIGSGIDVLFEDADDDVVGIGVRYKEENGITFSHRFRFKYDAVTDQLSAVFPETGVIQRGGPLFGDRFVYLNAERLGPRKTLPMSESRVRAFDIGSHGEYVLHFLLEHGASQIEPNDPRAASSSHRLIDQVDCWLQDISPGAHLDFEPIRSADLTVGGFKFDRKADVPSRRFRATNVGFGLSYSLPTVVALLAARTDSLILLENPEAHLHPRGQTRIGQLIARTAAAGVQVLLETHSDHVMEGVQIDVRDGILKPDMVSINYFTRRGFEVCVNSPKIDGDGRLSEWPEGFFDQHEQNLARLLSPKR